MEIQYSLPDIIYALSGGIILGLSSIMFLLLNGRVAGISGILRGLFTAPPERSVKAAFTLGLLFGGALMVILMPERFAVNIQRPLWVAIPAGLLVGIGTIIGNGCTSGHGICGLGGLSVRSLTAVITFLTTAVITATLTAGISW